MFQKKADSPVDAQDDKDFPDDLADMRNKINGIDSALIQLLAQRMDLAEEIGRFKSRNNIPVLQSARWEEVLERAIREGALLGLSEGFVTKLMGAVHVESLSRQERAMAK